MEAYIGDEQVILKLAGLRWIKKEDSKSLSYQSEAYYLKWNYKGAEGSTEYKDKEKRDSLYVRLLAELTKK